MSLGVRPANPLHTKAIVAGPDASATGTEAEIPYAVAAAQVRDSFGMVYVLAPETNRLLAQVLEQLTLLREELRNED